MRRRAREAIRRRHPDFTDRQIGVRLIEIQYGEHLGLQIRSTGNWTTAKMADADDIIAALAPVAQAFEQLAIRFYVGGSVASSYYGAMRTTFDVDLVADLEDEHVADFLRLLGAAYYASEPAIREAVRQRSSFNLVHFESSFKVDVFPNRRRPFDKRALARAQPGNLGGASGFEVPIASPEDSIISKLEWYRMGAEVSERQWNDVAILMKLLGDSVDVPYLRSSAAELGVTDLLERLL